MRFQPTTTCETLSGPPRQTRSFAQAVDWLRIDAETPAQVAATSLALYAATMDFAALHADTGAHWVRVVSGVCPDPGLLRCFRQAVAALVRSIGFPTLPDAAALEPWRHLPCWGLLVPAADS